MISLANKLLSLSVVLLCAPYAIAASEADFCSELSEYIRDRKQLELSNPSRPPTKEEQRLIDNLKIEVLEDESHGGNILVHGNGVFIVDIDNDGKDDLFAWGVMGSGHFVSAQIFDLPLPQKKQGDGEDADNAMEYLGFGRVDMPSFVRFKGINYILSYSGGEEDVVSRVVKLRDREYKGQVEYKSQVVCRKKMLLKVRTNCRHPACKRLKDVIESEGENSEFASDVELRNYNAGMPIYFPEKGSIGDFDNTQSPATIWRVNTSPYLYQDIEWSWLGQGKEKPEVSLRRHDPVKENRSVLPGMEHDRLRRVLAQQSQVLSRELDQSISLPNRAEFFLFSANNRTYWAWDFGENPYGEEIHIMYTNAKKSDYIGMIQMERSSVWVPDKSRNPLQ